MHSWHPFSSSYFILSRLSHGSALVLITCDVNTFYHIPCTLSSNFLSSLLLTNISVVIVQLLHVASMQMATLPGSPAAAIAEARMQMKLAEKNSRGSGISPHTASSSSTGNASASPTSSAASAGAVIHPNISAGTVL